ncbi:efflux RND transporter periplasmic adaptor subunit [Sediminicoccus rosea]|uniref:Efflux RND transporter periplasmic adaptor subunit n=1 Tax=Sediminicoccus rosea TaxID=1225128 RepID=A0ABZ0PDQ3_9PROT|nr:efflux RND transporter periplasmic adaptor subunit [Sediminicoccus rosea]WPB83765.1 efflux RND transporter periplasmic adaptor subunit [Sediminicoccus rosea]
MTLILGVMGPAPAHPGHDDDSTAVATALPRAETHSDLFEIVSVLQPGGVLTIYADRWSDNAPVDGSVTLTIDGQEVAAERQGIGLFVVRSPLLARPGPRDVVFTVSAGEEMDLLTARLDVPELATTQGAAASALALLRGTATQLALGALLLVVGVLLGRSSVRRPLPAMVEEDETTPAPVPTKPVSVEAPARHVAALGLGLALLAAPAWADPGHGSAPGSTSTFEAPRRLEDGAIFMPKGSQRLLTIRTQVTASGDASASIRMVGTLVPDPNASGRVQSSQPGRLEPTERGFPILGQRVERGDVLAFVLPTYSAAERGGLVQNAAELDAQITILDARVRRLVALRGSVSEREISEAQAELAGARQRRLAIQPALSGREPLVAPVSGVVSVVRGAVGQLVDSQVSVFDIVDPSRLWVEALAFERQGLDRVAGATATLADGRTVELTFMGRGLTVRQQAVPVNFRVESPPADSPIGSSVMVTLRTARQVQGIVLPADAVVRSAEGPPVVFEHATAERFVPRQVRVQPLDGTRVVVTAGLEAGRRVVVQGAGLIAQVR